ncbi:hypothetical protein Ava_B0347 (plasmid) [Trichormus variabilis ATCC 29413]|uniref:Uncharacterized protein n=2 Tax=Anabaena variabilis TaxID=264691 RepID=Q3M1T1_TRIV2|nr:MULTISPECIES: hypothetical protein [Nostocaceae]ABA25055.1 hypothetical protein Ava_B0347 [Trichormus variabilis ATCC 29413]MBC1217909.1 hypothetical protein [Trichormus variabilis ARAD]MBC1259105.1 hypothetical protein [Trichormus variabilis V5]MBC1270656.1 hypothetical protein [Trichormus variabilis FSR]MBC1305544.1 hypothetical protein [Trichormus variabilis N2B]
MKILSFLKPKPAQPTIDSYGQQSSGVDQQQIQSLMEWLFASFLNASYLGKSHIIWYDSDSPDPSLKQVIKKVTRRDEPVFLYRRITAA